MGLRVAAPLAVAIAVALRARVLTLPFILDDFLQLAMRTGRGWPARAVWDRFRLASGDPVENAALIDLGRLPWWTDPRLGLAPFRPLASLESALGYSLFGESPLLAHAVSLAWLSAAILSAALLFRAALPARASVLAVFAYAASRAHGMTVSWIANRCALLSAVFVALALHAYVRAREPGGRRHVFRSLVWLSLGLLSSEYALGAYGFLIAFEALRSGEPLAARARRLAPSLALLLPYAAIFRALGHGARATALYVDPLASPGKFAAIVLRNWPELVGLAFLPVPGIPPRLVTALGVSLAALLAGLLFRRGVGRASRQARWLFSGALVALVPVSVTLPQHRLLPVAEIGIAAAVAAVVSDAFEDGRVGSRLLAAGLAVIHLVLAPVGVVRDLEELRIHDFFARAALGAPLPPDPDADAVLLESTQVFALHYPLLVRRLAGLPVPRAWRVLACTSEPVSVTRPSETELELRSLGHGLLDDPQAAVYREPSVPLPETLTLAGGDFTVRILESGPAGPTRVRFAFRRSLDDPRMALFAAGPAGFQRVFLPVRGPEIVVPGG